MQQRPRILLYTVRMTAQASAASQRIYQIKVSLVGISPLIWRRLLGLTGGSV